MLRDSFQHDYLRQVNANLPVTLSLVQVDSYAQAFDMVRRGEADAAVISPFYGDRHAFIFGLRETPLIFLPTNLYFVSGEGRNTDVLDRIDTHLAQWRQEPQSINFQAQREAMLPPPRLIIPIWTQWVMSGGGLLILLFAGVMLLLRWQVRQRTAELNETSRRLDRLMQHSPVVIYALHKDADGNYRTEWVSENIEQIYGFTTEQALAPGWWQRHVHPEDIDLAREHFARLERQSSIIHEYRLIDAQGRIRFVRDELKAVLDPHDAGTSIVGAWSDITEARLQEERLNFVTRHDVLTGLPNRLMFRDTLIHALDNPSRDNKGVAILMMDLDRFRNINDTLGHILGDTLLMEAAVRISQTIPPCAMLARTGGDEFLLLIKNEITPRAIRALAQSLLDVFNQPLKSGNEDLTVTISIGISLSPEDGQDADTLIKHAELALYEAKAKGRNTFRFFSAELSQGAKEQLALENALRGACQRGELFLHYQPQIDANNGTLEGMEALVRWRHPDWGLVPPSRFIPLAEEIGVINEICNWVMMEACRQLKAWDAMGVYVPTMSVNLSVRQIENEWIAKHVRQILQETGLKAERLELEITESSLMREPDKAASNLDELKALGIKLAIDDFGTGYSSLSYLKRLSIDTLKIDRSFVHDIGKDANDEAICRAIIGMAHSLGLKTVAEGVESEIQEEFLRREGCDVAQGYLYSRPVPADEAIRLARRGQA